MVVFMRSDHGHAFKVTTKENLRHSEIEKQSNILIDANLSTILSGNVFDPNRGHITEKMNKQENIKPLANPKHNQFELTGIFKYRGTLGALIVCPSISDGANKKILGRMHKLGASLDGGYTLAAISDNQVTIVKEGKNIVLSLKKKQVNVR